MSGVRALHPAQMLDLSKNILYEDADIIVINKPSGIVVHPDGRTHEPSVSEWFVEKDPEATDVGEQDRQRNFRGITSSQDP